MPHLLTQTRMFAQAALTRLVSAILRGLHLSRRAPGRSLHAAVPAQARCQISAWVYRLTLDLAASNVGRMPLQSPKASSVRDPQFAVAL